MPQRPCQPTQLSHAHALAGSRWDRAPTSVRQARLWGVLLMACAFNAPFKGLQQGSNLIPLLSPWGALLFPWGALFLPLGGPCAALRVAQEWSSIRDIGRIFPRSLRLRPRPRACPTQPAQSYLLPLLYPPDQQGWPTKVTQDPGQYSQAWPFNGP